jgi:hypothetical membrane protein
LPDGETPTPAPNPIALAWERGRLGGLARRLHWVRGWFPSFGYWVGIFAAFYFWVAVSIDVYLNRSWWVFGASSFSALGDAGPNSTSAAAGLYWIYNDVVIFPTAILLMVFCAAMILAARNRIQSTAYSFFFVAAIFLFLVGVYHGETVNSAGLFCNPGCNGPPPYPPAYHDFVSDWFFIQADISFLILAVGLLVERRFGLGYLFLTLAILTPLLVDGLDHPVSVGIIAVGIFIFLIFDLTVLGMYRWKAVAPRFALGYQLVLGALLIPLGLADAFHNTSLSVAQNEAVAIIAIDLAAILMYWARNPRTRA